MKYSIIEIKELPLKKILKELNIGFRRFAKIAKVDYSYLFRAEQGRHIVSEEFIIKIKKAITKLYEKKEL